MNERIKQLAEQVTQEFSPTFERDKWQERFAELIVDECVTVAAKFLRAENLKLCDNNYISPWNLQVKLEDHFGIENE